MLVGPGGPSLGPSAVVVTPDPGLLEASPSTMQAAASQLAQMAHQTYSYGQKATAAGQRLLETWSAAGATNFSTGDARSCAYAVPTAAEGLIGASQALETAAAAIQQAQTTAQQALSLASSTNQSASRLQSAYASSSSQAVDALPDDATLEQVSQASAPTPGQAAQANQLDADATRAYSLMNEANTQAEAAWRQLVLTLDAITADSTSVQNQVVAANVKEFSKTMDNEGALIMALAMSGALEGGFSDDGDDGEDDEVIDPGDLTADEKAALEELDDEVKDLDGESTDGTKLDPTTAAMAEGVPVGWLDAATVQANYEQALLDPHQASIYQGADPFGGTDPAEVNQQWWDPSANGGKGGWKYPPNNGAVAGTEAPAGLQPGEDVDRIGNPAGQFASPAGTPYQDRGLPPTSAGGEYTEWVVTDKINDLPSGVTITAAQVEPAFGQPGGGVQYTVSGDIPGTEQAATWQWLADHGYVQQVYSSAG